MKRFFSIFFFLFLSVAVHADWRAVRSGIDYQEFAPNPPFTYHVARIRLSAGVRVIATSEAERGATVSRFASEKNAIVAINGDYFDQQMRPIGFALGPCGRWSSQSPEAKRKEQIIAIGTDRADILEASEQVDLPDWMQSGISGWPMLVRSCHALTSQELPGSDAFTRAPHPRTAVGVSKDGKTLYWVVADGMKEQAAGVTLADLAEFMRSQLGVCEAVNLDGGGSSAMTIDEKLVTKPPSGSERVVANHLAVVAASDFKGCTAPATNGSTASVEWWNDVDEILPGKGTMQDGTYVISFPRRDLTPDVDGIDIDPALGFTTTLAIRSLRSGTIATGDLVVSRDEAARVKTLLRAGRLNVLSSDAAPGASGVFVIHFSGAGSPTAIGHTFRRALDATATVSAKSTRQSTADWSEGAVDKLRAIRGVQSGTGNLLTISIPAVNARYRGELLPANFGLQSNVALQPIGDGDLAAGGFIVTTRERAAKISRALTAAHFKVSPPHRLLSSTTPMAFVMQVWGTGDAMTIAKSLSDAVSR